MTPEQPKLMCYDCSTPTTAKFEVECNDDEMKKPVCEYHMVEYIEAVGPNPIEVRSLYEGD